MNVLIVEDEKAAARNLTCLLEEIDAQINVVGVVDSVVDSVEWLDVNMAPELIFMDIHLADGSAFDIFERCTVESPVVFTTAYDEYALKAFKVNSVDYLLKPISRVDLSQSIDKFRRIYHSASPSNDSSSQNLQNLQRLLHTIHRAQNHTTHLLLPKGGCSLVPLSVSDVSCFFIENGVVKARSFDGRLHTVPYTLDQLSEMVNSAHFFRANRQFLITRDDVLDIELWFGSRLSVRLKSAPDTKIIINKPRVTEFKAWFSGA